MRAEDNILLETKIVGGTEAIQNNTKHQVNDNLITFKKIHTRSTYL